MKNRHFALQTLLLSVVTFTACAPVWADPGQDQGLPEGGEQQLVPMQPMMGTPTNYPAQAGAPPQGYPQQPMQSGYPPQYGNQPYQQGGYAPQGYPQQGQPYAAGVSEAVPGQVQQMPPQQMPPQQMAPPHQGYQQPSPYEMQEQAIKHGHMQNRSELDKYSPPPEVPDGAPDPSYKGKVSKGPGIKGVAGKAAKILGRTTQAAAPYAASFLVTTAAYKMANRNNNNFNRGYGYGGMPMGGYGMPMGGYGYPMGGMVPGMGMYGMPGMGMGMPMGFPSF